MLGANLVIQATYAKPRTPLPDADKSRKELKFQTSDEDLTPENVPDGKFVLPWLQHVSFRLKKRPQAARTFYLCETKTSGRPDDIPPIDKCEPLVQPVLSPDGLKYDVELPSVDRLTPGSSYAICTPSTKPAKDSNGYFCTRFSVYSPFFLYPNRKVKAKGEDEQAYADPEPYFLNEGGDVAVFGVVDPDIRSFVGEINTAWENTHKQYKTEVVVLDPAEALDQQLQYFERHYRMTRGHDFAGTKILLAQMAPPLARQLAARLRDKKFTLVISEADTEQATQNGTFTLRPISEDPRYKGTQRPSEGTGSAIIEVNTSRQGTVNKAPTFVAVPPPYFDSDIGYPVLQIRGLDIEHRAGNADKDKTSPVEPWTFTVFGSREVEVSPTQPLPIETIRGEVDKALRAQLEQDLIKPSQAIAGDSEELRKLALVALKKKFKADVALMQKRDFYFGQPPSSAGPGANPAEALERILWKGDLAVKAMVKGSTLLKVLQDSARFEAQDAQSLSLDIAQGRQLVKLGIFYDKLRDEYLVNGEVLDPNRLYSVATTDYIACGQTGYPEIAEPGFDNPLIPREFPKEIYQISSLICDKIREMQGASAGYSCLAKIWRDPYLDGLDNEPTDRGPSLTSWRRFALWTHIPFIWRPGMHQAESRKQLSDDPVELSAQDRRVFSIKHSSAISLTATDNSVSEAQRKAFFSGISSPSQLQAKESHELIITLKDRFGISGRRVDFYFQPELAYDNVVTGQPAPPAVVNLQQNLAAGEIGLFLHQSRNYARFGLLLSLRDESQLQHPIETVTLADAKQSSLTFDRARSNAVYGHFGLRLEDRHSFIEAGFQMGGVSRVTAFNFRGPAGVVSCPFAATADGRDEPACVADNSNDAPGMTPAITSLSKPSAIMGSALRYGWFSNMQLLVPLFSWLSYTFNNQFDYFYAGRGPISTDMLYRDLWSNSLSIQITRNLAVAPKFDVFFYQNQVKHNAFRQVQSSISIKYAFDWFSGSRWRTALRYTEPKQ
jgi:hypothetical protein